MDKVEIFNLKGMGMSIRHTEYGEITSAVAELVDNSIEAGASSISIFLHHKTDSTSGKDKLKDLYILDNGSGMDAYTLHRCLSFGSTTREDEKSIGKFGVGLGQASLFAAPEVEVYSWQDDIHNSLMTELSSLKMTKGLQTYIDSPKKCEIPRLILDKIESRKKLDEYSQHGTLVRWKDVDQQPYKRPITFIDRLTTKLGKVFRKYIDDGLCITIIPIHTNVLVTQVESIDPMFLSMNAKYLGYNYNLIGKNDSNRENAESLFEPFETKEFLITTELGQTGKVIVESSIVKEKFYYNNEFMTSNSPGDSIIGKEVRKYEGISILRANREVDFGLFGIFSNLNMPTHRWWGMNIYFDTSLDDFFKISSNKQHVEIPGNNNSLKDHDKDNKYDDNWSILLSYCKETVSRMVKRNKELAKEYKSMQSTMTMDSSEEHLDLVSESDCDNSKVNIEDVLFDDSNKKVLNKTNILEIKTDNVKFVRLDYTDDVVSCEIKRGIECIFSINLNSFFFETIDISNNSEALAMIKLMLMNLNLAYETMPGIQTMDFVNQFVQQINKMCEEMI